MKALTIKVAHGRVWTAETSDGKRAQGASLISVLDQLVPVEHANQVWTGLDLVFAGIRDSGGDSNIGSGQASA